MDLAGRQTRHFEVEIPWLLTEHEIPDRAADQPDPPTPTTNGVFNAAKDFPQGGIGKTKAGRHLEHRIAEERRGFFRRHRIDVETSAPFEAGDLREFRDDLQVPMVILPGFLMQGRTVEDEVV
jgi:hypothetical protein